MKAGIVHHLFLSGVLAFCILPGCGDSKREPMDGSTAGSTGGTTGGMGDRQETMAEQLPNEMDMYFDEAMINFDNGDYKTAADSIMSGVKSIRNELKKTGRKQSAKLQKSLTNLEMLARKVRAGKVKSDMVLANAFAHADAALAHDYLVITETYVAKNPDKLQKAVDGLASALRRGARVAEEESREEYDELTSDAESLRNKISGKGKKDQEAIREELAELKQKLEALDARLEETSASAGKRK